MVINEITMLIFTEIHIDNRQTFYNAKSIDHSTWCIFDQPGTQLDPVERLHGKGLKMIKPVNLLA
jgi:hypothetical protein